RQACGAWIGRQLHSVKLSRRLDSGFAARVRNFIQNDPQKDFSRALEVFFHFRVKTFNGV
ncbi:hypothetical protein, partial [Salmonella enterica]|uniref:hypothetical protein n=1 Tax=Salmonella enterica TaxID=28901 RepID=UPI002A761FCC